tara:strand:+ start:473 stop:760 length:288 start_codon:yes stop_codon:yes gene_type:complete
MRKVIFNARHGGFGLSEEALKLLAKKKGRSGMGSSESHSLARHDEDLVSVFEELGSVRASDSYAKLELKEVQGDYYIDEYDGYEGVVEPKDIIWI